MAKTQLLAMAVLVGYVPVVCGQAVPEQHSRAPLFQISQEDLALIAAKRGVDPSSPEIQQINQNLHRSGSRPKKGPIPEPALQSMADMLGVPVESKEMIKFVSGLQRGNKAGNPMREAKVIAHLTAEQGILLPTKDEARASFEKDSLNSTPEEILAAMDPQILAKAIAEVEQGASVSIADEVPPHLERCAQNKSEKMSVPVGLEKEPGAVFDYLITNARLPMNLKEVIGNNVQVFNYSSEKGDLMSLYLASENVPCLPFRVRASKSAVYFHQGLDALKNYDADFNGSGKLHPTIMNSPSDYQ